MKDKIDNLEKYFDQLNSEVSRLEGKIDHLKDCQNILKINLEKFKEDKFLHEKAVEVLSLVQKITRDSIKKEFETLVTYALRYILDDDYKFTLEFGKRGNLQEMDFNIQTPDFKEPMDLLDTSAGGILDIVSIALRVVLLEISVPKNNGFILLDEACKHLSKNHTERACLFLGELNKKLKRQIIFITHEEAFINNPDYNKIKIDQ